MHVSLQMPCATLYLQGRQLSLLSKDFNRADIATTQFLINGCAPCLPLLPLSLLFCCCRAASVSFTVSFARRCLHGSALWKQQHFAPPFGHSQVLALLPLQVIPAPGVCRLCGHAAPVELCPKPP